MAGSPMSLRFAYGLMAAATLYPAIVQWDFVGQLSMAAVAVAVFCGLLVAAVSVLFLFFRARRGDFMLTSRGPRATQFVVTMAKLLIPMTIVVVVVSLAAGPSMQHRFAAMIVCMTSYAWVGMLGTVGIEARFGRRFIMSQGP